MNSGNPISMMDLIPVPQEIKDELADLNGIRLDRQREAYRSLIEKHTPREIIKRRPIRGGKEADYVPAWWFVDQANALFGHLWSFEVIEQYVGKEQVWVKGQVRVTLPGEEYTEFTPEGNTRNYKRDPITIVKTQYGGSDISKSKDGKIIDIGDTMKTAATDSMKKCLTLLGIAADVYGDRETLEFQRKTEKAQKDLDKKLAIAHKIGSEIGWSSERVDQLVKDRLGKDLSELEADDGIEILRIMRAAVKEAEQDASESTEEQEGQSGGYQPLQE